eukprot:gnl/TRDRNA2_/TRDRNA2_35426_c0_seq1.p1 gnl/TRDRNA2_/TRDRNA2_35426_c0~~gnl/TRDRNA2_/TRDRNA2_35426_c0_seq1.p1  ORF type:complete len:767 (-),score=157.52 gnl/TRDRNA2_/TRDRNA2_35426_c0_seq1:122-2422(-)
MVVPRIPKPEQVRVAPPPPPARPPATRLPVPPPAPPAVPTASGPAAASYDHRPHTVEGHRALPSLADPATAAEPYRGQRQDQVVVASQLSAVPAANLQAALPPLQLEQRQLSRQSALAPPPAPAAAPELQSSDSIGSLLPGEEERPTLRWEGRRGIWRENAMQIIAPVLADFEVELVAADLALDEVRQDLQSQLSSMLPEQGFVGSVSDLGAVGKRKCFQASLICNSDWAAMQRQWSARYLCGQRAIAYWTRTVDTTSEEHLARVKASGEPKANALAVQLELPARWCFKSIPTNSRSVPLKGGAHWYHFATIFGEVSSVEFAWRSSTDTTVQLLTQFRAAPFARNMYEVLSGRLLYNPLNSSSDRCFPVRCTPGHMSELRTSLMLPTPPPAPAATGGLGDAVSATPTSTAREPMSNPLGAAVNAGTASSLQQLQQEEQEKRQRQQKLLQQEEQERRRQQKLLEQQQEMLQLQQQQQQQLLKQQQELQQQAQKQLQQQQQLLQQQHWQAQQQQQQQHAAQQQQQTMHQQAPQQAPLGVGPVFVLRRASVNGVAVAPSETQLSPSKPNAIIGREATCDLVVQSHHVSRHHAKLLLLQSPNVGSRVLVIEDMSTNGTWVNGKRMLNGQISTLNDGDQVSFEAADDPNFPVYLVRQYADEHAAAAAVNTCEVVGVPPLQDPGIVLQEETFSAPVLPSKAVASLTAFAGAAAPVLPSAGATKRPWAEPLAAAGTAVFDDRGGSHPRLTLEQTWALGGPGALGTVADMQFLG